MASSIGSSYGFETASKGANGILIAKEFDWTGTQGRDDRYIFVGANYGGKFYNFPVTTAKPRKLVAIAVFVIKP